MSDFEWKTKKEKILENARKDPFLKIDDLAEIASTTPRYVRTILSEANMSLMQLRKEYARKIENRNSNICDRLLLNYLISVPFSSESQVLVDQGLIFNSPEDFNLLSGDINHDYICRSYIHQIKEVPWCVSTALVKEGEIHSNNKTIAVTDMLTNLCNLLQEQNLKVSSIDLEIELATNQIANLLEISPLAPVFRVRQTLCYNSEETETIVLMLLYFNYKQVTLSFSHNNGLVIDRKRANG